MLASLQRVWKDDAATLLARMRRLSSTLDDLHEEAQRVCHEVTAEARRARGVALKRKPVRAHSPRKR